MIGVGTGANMVVKQCLNAAHEKLMQGYCMKDFGTPHFMLRTLGYTEDELRTFRQDY